MLWPNSTTQHERACPSVLILLLPGGWCCFGYKVSKIVMAVFMWGSLSTVGVVIGEG